MEGKSRWGRELKKERQAKAKTGYCRVYKNLQHQVRLWAKRIEVKCFLKDRDREQWEKDRITNIFE